LIHWVDADFSGLGGFRRLGNLCLHSGFRRTGFCLASGRRPGFDGRTSLESGGWVRSKHADRG
jgi:hypothetical protein